MGGKLGALLSLRHNLRPGKLEAISTRQAIPHPSLAVVPVDNSFTPFGNYTLVVDPRKVSPSRANPLYPRDVYTQRGPLTSRISEEDAIDLLESSDAYLTQKLAVEQSPEFHSWESFKKSPHGAKLLQQNPDYSQVETDFFNLAQKLGRVTPDGDFSGLTPELLEFIRSMPSQYGELKMSSDLPFSKLLFLAGPKSEEIRTIAEGALGIPFEPTKSQLRLELPSLIRKYGGAFKKGGLVRMKEHRCGR